MAKKSQGGNGRDNLLEMVGGVTDKGEWPMLEPMPEHDEAPEVLTAAGLDEGLTASPTEPADHLTPRTLIGDHREGHWASREDEHDRGLDDDGAGRR